MVFGDVSTIQDPLWFIIELRSEKTAGPTLKRLGKMIPDLFEKTPVEVFIPISRRDHENFEIKSDCLVFVHSDSAVKVRGLRSVIGVASLFVDENTRKPLRVDDEYVRGLISEAREEYRLSSMDISVGSFVRILDGENRDYCGTVMIINDNRAQVKVVLKGRVLLVDTPLGNLVNLNHVPEELRTYYYCDLIDNYHDEMGEAALKAIQEDLICDTPLKLDILQISSKPKKHRSRHETVTARVRCLIDEGEKDLLQIADKVLVAISEDRVKKPKTAHIVYSIVKRNVVDRVYGNNPEVKTFRDVLRITGSPFSLKWVEEKANSLGISFDGSGDDEG
jgi:hypothetical protein